jgi:hypothetical protein
MKAFLVFLLVMYPIFDVTNAISDRPEALGTKEKTWIMPSDEMGLPIKPHLFKIGRAGTGEDWAEKVACELLKILGVPCAEYHLAIRDNARGVISERFYPEQSSFVPANMILARVDKQYDGSLRFKQRGYKLPIVLGVLRRLNLEHPLNVGHSLSGLSTHEIFVGYLIFDCFIGNTDRHHENWGVVISRQSGSEASFHLAPSFDHASSLGRNETDERRKFRLSTKDHRATVEAYAERSRSAFYGLGSNARTLTQRELTMLLAGEFPVATKFWANKIASIALSTCKDIFGRINPEIVSGEAIEFALRMLAYNKQMIKEVADGV